MKSLAKILLIIVLSCTSAAAFSYTLSEQEVRDAIVKEVKKDVRSYTDGETEVKITSLMFKGLKTNSLQAPQIKVISNHKKFLHRDIKKVEIKDGPTLLTSFPVNVQIYIYKNVVVAKDYIRQFEAITPTNTEVKRMEVGMFINKVLPELDEKRPAIAMKNFAPDSLILKDYTRTKPDIVRNTEVTLVFTSQEGLVVQTEGVALGEGNVGDTVLVKNTKYNKVHSGKITNKNEITVGI